MSEYVSEAGHWYTKDGLPAYTQEVASGPRKGLDRPTTIRDARKLSLVPSVTTINNILDKPALTHWLVKEAVAKAVAHERGMEYMESDAAAHGTRIHGALEEWIHGRKVDSGYEEYVSILEAVFTEVGVHEPTAERSFASPLGYGGAVDCSSTEGDGTVIDFKTKDMSEEDVAKGKKFAYDEHAMQLAAYRIGLGLPKARCYNLFLSRTDPTVHILHEWTEEELKRGEEMFLGCFYLWKHMKNYKPEEV